ncbi:MAG: acetyltransferase [Candidatus Binatia bacterium]|nr:acetyltransferase [Candidatus Binatia bacterium]
MVTLIGDGGHAKVIKELLRMRIFIDGTVIAVGDNRARKTIAENLPSEIIAPALVHTFATVTHGVELGAGTVVMAGAVVQTGTKIGKHVILNTGCTVDHDCVIEDYAHIAPGAHLCGGVHVGEGTLVGVGVAIAPGAKIPAWSLVKARRLEIVAL